MVLLSSLLPAPARALPLVATIYHTQKIPIRSGQLEIVKVTCPKGYKATDGSTFPLPLDVVLVKNVSRDDERLFLVSPAGYGETTVTFVVTCVRKPKKKLILKRGGKVVVQFPLGLKVSTKKFQVRHGATIQEEVKCAKDKAPVGTELQIDTAVAPRAKASDAAPGIPDLRFHDSMPVRGGWQYFVENAGKEDASGQLGVRCADRELFTEKQNRRLRQRFKVLRRSTQEAFGPGANTTSVDCQPGTVPLTQGWSVGAGLEILGAHPDPKKQGLDFLIANGKSGPVGGTFYGLCVEGERTAEVM